MRVHRGSKERKRFAGTTHSNPPKNIDPQGYTRRHQDRGLTAGSK
ncbi:MAG: hypothetical protein AAFY11_03525 [Cyanobacteria bacterium J06641_5]